MYSQLVSHALAEHHAYDGAGDAELFETVVRLRMVLPAELDGRADGTDGQTGAYSGEAPRDGPDGVTSRVADEVAYDVALMTFCRRLGIDHGPERFHRPDVERRTLEDELARRGYVVTR
jgi:hypothetical protein